MAAGKPFLLPRSLTFSVYVTLKKKIKNEIFFFQQSVRRSLRHVKSPFARRNSDGKLFLISRIPPYKQVPKSLGQVVRRRYTADNNANTDSMKCWMNMNFLRHSRTILGRYLLPHSLLLWDGLVHLWVKGIS